jgi:hypothetical protein
LVVVPARPQLGVARLERLLPPGDAAPTSARLFCYDDGSFVIVPLADVTPAPPGVWDRTPGER